MKHSAFLCGTRGNPESLICTLTCFQECGEHRGRVGGKNVEADGQKGVL